MLRKSLSVSMWLRNADGSEDGLTDSQLGQEKVERMVYLRDGQKFEKSVSSEEKNHLTEKCPGFLVTGTTHFSSQWAKQHQIVISIHGSKYLLSNIVFHINPKTSLIIKNIIIICTTKNVLRYKIIKHFYFPSVKM